MTVFGDWELFGGCDLHQESEGHVHLTLILAPPAGTPPVSPLSLLVDSCKQQTINMYCYLCSMEDDELPSEDGMAVRCVLPSAQRHGRVLRL